MTISQAASVNLWREAILDRLAALCMDAPQDEPPASILRRIIAAEVEIALDPSVSDAVPRRTLLQMALDALENSYLSDEHRNYELQAKAIAALREALAADHLRDVAEKAAPVPLTDSELAKIAVEDEFLLYCDQDSFNEIARAIELAHGITGGKP